MASRRTRSPELVARKNVSIRQNLSSSGMRQAHNDLISFLYTTHGEAYDEYVGTAESITALPREKIVYVLIAIVSLYLIAGTAAQLVCNLIGFAYPAYASVKAVRTKDTKDDTQWLIYWCVFANFCLIDYFSSSIMQYFPFYWLAKAAFLIYLYLPQTMGAQYLFYSYVNPMVTAIDEYLEKRKKK
ncbi:TB2/DP1, HVA22 family [Ancylostoma ceylanicum]|uniref:Receptor expression-enhancing protein n=2 Tax=Ancylostoma ceylanicum TaxID=53326 RepID=A0A0D6LIB3_9BILA|nr:TB2/DP1, HVA22 family [Ancylostoma ceylanicum]EYB84905.1 hypothetical protein Y032_0308g2061 [Ancylostoma ceylanicum]